MTTGVNTNENVAEATTISGTPAGAGSADEILKQHLDDGESAGHQRTISADRLEQNETATG